MKGGLERKRRGGVVSANMVWLSCEGTDGGGGRGRRSKRARSADFNTYKGGGKKGPLLIGSFK